MTTARISRRPLSPEFKVIYTTTVAVTLFFAVGAALMIYFPPRADHGLVDAFSSVFKVGTGAIFATWRGRAAAK